MMGRANWFKSLEPAKPALGNENSSNSLMFEDSWVMVKSFDL